MSSIKTKKLFSNVLNFDEFQTNRQHSVMREQNANVTGNFIIRKIQVLNDKQ